MISSSLPVILFFILIVFHFSRLSAKLFELSVFVVKPKSSKSKIVQITEGNEQV